MRWFEFTRRITLLSIALGCLLVLPCDPVVSRAFAADVTPHAFGFASVLNVPRGSVQTSAPVTITGIDSPAPMYVVDGFYSIGCAGPYVASPGVISNGQSICVRHTASALPSTVTTTTLTVGGVSGSFSSATLGVRPTDFGGSGRSAVVWRDNTSALAVWLMNGTGVEATGFFNVPPDWQVEGAGDFDGDRRADLVWRRPLTGETAIWFMNGTDRVGASFFTVPPEWSVAAVADVDGDGMTDILWRRYDTGDLAIWFMNGGSMTSVTFFNVPTNWTLETTGDFNGDGSADLLWRDRSSGLTALWLMHGASIAGTTFVSVPVGWDVVLAADLDGDGKSDIVWRHAGAGNWNDYVPWFMDGTTIVRTTRYNVATDWVLAGAGDFDGSGVDDLLWRNDASAAALVWYAFPSNGTFQLRFFSLAASWYVVAP
jgi:hypothetical protein